MHTDPCKNAVHQNIYYGHVPTHHTHLPTLILETIKYLKNNFASFKPHLENKPANNLIKNKLLTASNRKKKQQQSFQSVSVWHWVPLPIAFLLGAKKPESNCC